MTREVDRRNTTQNLIQNQQGWRQRVLGASERLADGVTLEVESWNPDLGTPRRVTFRRTDGQAGGPAGLAGLVAHEGQATDQPRREGDYVDAALAAIQRVPDALGIRPGGGALGVDGAPAGGIELRPERRTTVTSQGARTVTVRQELDGLPIFDSSKTVHFDPTDAITGIVGRNYDVSRASVPERPALSVEDAVLRAAEHCAVPEDDELGRRDQFGQPLEPASVDLTDFRPTVLATFDGTRPRYTVLAPGPFAEAIRANRCVFPIDPEDVRIAWRVQLTMPGGREGFDVVVDGTDGEVLYAAERGQGLRGRGNVFLVDGGGEREPRPFPEPPESYPVAADLSRQATTAVVDDWIPDDGAGTAGTQVVAEYEDSSGSAFSGWEGLVLQGDLRQDGPEQVVEFAPPDPSGPEQELLNAFYWTNVASDFFGLLGVGDDERIHMRVYPQSIDSTAYYVRDAAGRPTLNMGSVSSPAGRRHTALSSNVVFHEFTHHVTTELVGHPGNVPQSRAMMEGWSDYFACTLNETDVVGPWLLDDPGGLRRHPYDEAFPATFGDVGREGFRGAYEIGEIWCATLMQLNRVVGDRMGWQLVADSLKIAPEHPTLLDGRDAVVRALDDAFQAGSISAVDAYFLRRGVWETFARFGMGRHARTHGPRLPPSPDTAHRYITPSDAAVADGLVAMAASPAGDGYWIADADGGTYQCGDVPFYGWLGGSGVDVVDVASTPAGDGYWLVGRDGAVAGFGNAPVPGSARGRPSEAAEADGAIRGIVPHPSGSGYWLYTEHGGVYAFGDGVPDLGSASGHVEAGSIVDCAATPDGTGYWLVDVFGSVYSFGSAPHLGDLQQGGAEPVAAMAATPSGGGYLLVDSVGTVTPFGDADAAFHGSVEGRVPKPVVDVELTPSAGGYWLLCAGSAPGTSLVHAFGDATEQSARPVHLQEYLDAPVPTEPSAPPEPAGPSVPPAPAGPSAPSVPAGPSAPLVPAGSSAPSAPAGPSAPRVSSGASVAHGWEQTAPSTSARPGAATQPWQTGWWTDVAAPSVPGAAAPGWSGL